MKLKPESPIRCPEYLIWLRQQPCVLCGAPAPSQAAHIGRRGMGQKPDDLSAIPLCHNCHIVREHGGRLSEEERAELGWLLARTLIQWIEIKLPGIVRRPRKKRVKFGERRKR